MVKYSNKAKNIKIEQLLVFIIVNLRHTDLFEK